jgi:hypothetical protein
MTIAKADLDKSAIDLERSELRYVFYARDEKALIEEFEKLGFDKKIYEDSPITRTIYFSGVNGLEPGLSIKARLYAKYRTNNVWNLTSDTLFNLLEIKTTVSQDELINSDFIEESSPGLIDYISVKQDKDIVFRIQKASEDGILHESSLKSKNRLDKWSDESDSHKTPYLKYSEIVTILSRETELDKRLSPVLVKLLNDKIRGKEILVPYVMTQYNRIHLVHQDNQLTDYIRITIDPGVEYFRLFLVNPDDYPDDASSIAEYLIKERFYRLEFKMDINNLQKVNNNLLFLISEIVANFKAVAYLSKKWIGATLVSERHISDQSLWDETASVGKVISGYFSVDPSWFNYRTILNQKGFFELIQGSASFQLYELNPQVLVKSENWVTGYVGVPNPSLIVHIEGPMIKYNLPPKVSPVILPKDKPAFFIMEEDKFPIRSLEISSKSDLEKALHASIEISGVSEFRSYGFLVVSKKSNRVYKLTVERKTDHSDNNTSKINTYCKMRYIGRKDGIGRNVQEINYELEQFYHEFANIMLNPLAKFEKNSKVPKSKKRN